MRPQVGQVINNKYRLLRLIGDGGMGSVYEARHEVLGTSVALKFLHPELTRRPGLVQRFLQEARVSAQIQSPHVVRVTDVDQTHGGAFIVMEYLEGKTLQTLYEELYRAGRQLSYADALEYAMQMLEGVEAAHKHGIVHRDLKPDNVMITIDPKGRPLLKLLDFGIAKLKVEGDYAPGLTRPGVIMGTPEYMAPEQAYSADAVDARADVFALGVLIFEMLAGRRPVGGDDPQQIATAYLTGRIAHLNQLAPRIAPELAAAIHHALAPLTKDRCQSVTALRDAIEPFAAAVKAPSAMPPTGSFSLPGLSRAPTTPVPAAHGGTAPLAPGSAPVAATPAATNVVADVLGARAVPKTLPPVDEPSSGPQAAGPQARAPSASLDPTVSFGAAVPPRAGIEATVAFVEAAPPVQPSPRAGIEATVAFVEPARPALPADTNPDQPPAMSSPAEVAPRPRATPVGGFAPVDVRGSGSAVPQAPVDPGVGYVPPTTSAAPYVPEATAPAVDGGATAFAAPIDIARGPLREHPAIAPLGPEGAAGRASGTAVGDAFYAGATPPDIGPAFRPPTAQAPAALPTKPKARPRGLASSLPAILLLAAGAAGAVVGVAYFAQNRSTSDDRDDPGNTSAPSASVRADPPPVDAPPPPDLPPSARPQAMPPAKVPPKPGFPPPKGSGTLPQTQPSSTPSTRPVMPVIIIPSSLPFPFPFQQEPPRQQPRDPEGPRPRPPRQPPPGDPMDGP